jgi:hypothetical protein
VCWSILRSNFICQKKSQHFWNSSLLKRSKINIQIMSCFCTFCNCNEKKLLACEQTKFSNSEWLLFCWKLHFSTCVESRSKAWKNFANNVDTKNCKFIFNKMILFQILFLMISLMFLPAAIYGAFQQIKFSQLHVKPTSWVAKYGSKPSR